MSESKERYYVSDMGGLMYLMNPSTCAWSLRRGEAFLFGTREEAQKHIDHRAQKIETVYIVGGNDDQ